MPVAPVRELPPLRTPLPCESANRFHRWVWAAFTVAALVSLVPKTSTTTSPFETPVADVDTADETPVLVFVVPIGVAWSTPAQDVAPQTASALPENVTTMLCVPLAGATSRHNSTRALSVFVDVTTAGDVNGVPLKVTEVTVRFVAPSLARRSDTPTTSSRLDPLPTVWFHVHVDVLDVVEDAASNVTWYAGVLVAVGTTVFVAVTTAVFVGDGVGVLVGVLVGVGVDVGDDEPGW